MIKFKVGDKVKLVEVDEADINAGLREGYTGSVIEDSYTPFVKWNKDINSLDNEYCVTSYQIELIKED